MSDFALEEWEVPVGLDVPLVAPADAVAESPTGILLLRVVRVASRRFVIFAQQGKNNFLLVQFERWKSLKPAIWNTRPTPQKLKRIAARIGGRSCRLFELASFLVVRDGATGVLTNALVRVLGWNNSRAIGAWVSNDLSLPIYFSFPPGGDLRQSLQQSLDGSLTTVRAAWEWKNLEENERLARIELAQSRLDEVQQVGSWALQSAPLKWENLDHVLFFSQKGKIALIPIGNFFPAKPIENFFPTIAQGKFFEMWWSNLLAKIFAPQHSLVLRFNRNGDLGDSNDFSLKINSSTPTHHERIEARLRLREWLEHNAPDRMDLLP